NLLDRLFVDGVGERPKQRNRNSLGAFFVDQIAQRRFDFGLVQFAQDFARGIDAFTNAMNEIGIYQGVGTFGLDDVLDAVFGQSAPAAIGTAGNQNRILKALCGQQPDFGAVAGQDGVIDNG